MILRKKAGVYYVLLHRGGTYSMISTHKTEERAARRAGERIIAEFDREKATKSMALKLADYAKQLARQELDKGDLKGQLAALEREAYLAALSVIDEIYPAPGITASDLWDNYMVTEADNVKPSTLRTKQQRYAKFSEWSGDRDVSKLNETLCRTFLDSLHCAAQTWNNYISDLSSVFKAYSGVSNPWTESLRKSATNEHKETKPVTMEEVKAILSFCDANPERIHSCVPLSIWAAFVRTLYYTGQRPVDVCHLERREVHDGLIDLMPEKTSRTRKKVSYFADPHLIAVLDSIPDDGSGFYFKHLADIYDTHRANLSAAFKHLMTLCGVSESVLMYGFRHFFVTYQLNSGKSKEDVASAVGHSSTKVTNDFYYHGKQKVVLSSMPEL